MSDPSGPETLGEFAASLSYGTRTDLSFKFLPKYSDDEVGDLLASILREVGSLFDHGDPGALIDLAIELQAAGYGRGRVDERYQYPDGPFVAPSKPTSDSKVALLTSSGHFAAGDDPEPFGVEAMSQDEAVRRIGDFLKEEPTLSEIPVETSDLVVRHGGYDIRGSQADHNVSFPIDRLREAADHGEIAEFVSPAFSFVGACAQLRLRSKIAPAWAERIAETGADVALLVPV